MFPLRDHLSGCLPQVCIFVKSVQRATQLDKLLQDCNFPSICIHSGLTQDQRYVPPSPKLARPSRTLESDPSFLSFPFALFPSRIERYRQFKAFEKRILVATDIFGRGIDVERVNIVINYDQTSDADSYLHRVGRAGRFGTRGLAITFVTSDADKEILEAIQSRFEVKVEGLPEVIEPSTYSQSRPPLLRRSLFLSPSFFVRKLTPPQSPSYLAVTS